MGSAPETRTVGRNESGMNGVNVLFCVVQTLPVVLVETSYAQEWQSRTCRRTRCHRRLQDFVDFFSEPRVSEVRGESVGVLAFENHPERAHDDVKVEAQRPVAQIVEVEIDARLHLVQRFGFAAVPVYLRPARDSGLHLVAQHVSLDELAIELVMRDGVRSWTDDAHATLEYVEELRQFVERSASQKGADGGEARVATLRLNDGAAVLGDPHRAELVDHDLLAVESVPTLSEDDRTPGTDFHGDGGGQHEWRCQRDDEQRQDDVARALQDPAESGKGRFANRDDRQPADGIHAPLDEVREEDVGDEVDGRRGVPQVIEEAEDPRLRSHRQRDVDDVDAVVAHEGRQRPDSPEQAVGSFGVNALVAPVVEEAGDAGTQIGVELETPCQLYALLIEPRDHRSALTLHLHQTWARQAKQQVRAGLACRCDPEPGQQHFRIEIP